MEFLLLFVVLYLALGIIVISFTDPKLGNALMNPPVWWYGVFALAIWPPIWLTRLSQGLHK